MAALKMILLFNSVFSTVCNNASGFSFVCESNLHNRCAEQTEVLFKWLHYSDLLSHLLCYYVLFSGVTLCL